MSILRYKRATAAVWLARNPVLALAEPGWETDTRRSKTGDGATPWSGLPYDDEVGGLDVYAENVTGTNVVIPDGGNVPIPGTTIVVPVTSRPVYLEASALLQCTSLPTPGTAKFLGVMLRETANGVDTPVADLAAVWHPAFPGAVYGTTPIGPYRLADNVTTPRTFQLRGFATTGIAGNVVPTTTYRAVVRAFSP